MQADEMQAGTKSMMMSDARHKKTAIRGVLRRLCVVQALLTASMGLANDTCFDSVDPDKVPFTVATGLIEDRINSDEHASGIVLSITADESVLRVDILAMPGSTSVAAATRVVWMIGRLAERTYSEMRFSDDGTDIFLIGADDIQSIGCQFVWGEVGGGQNPIHLLRRFADALRYPDGERVAPRMTGSLLGDTTIAIETMNTRFVPDWVLRTLDMTP